MFTDTAPAKSFCIIAYHISGACVCVIISPLKKKKKSTETTTSLPREGQCEERTVSV